MSANPNFSVEAKKTNSHILKKKKSCAVNKYFPYLIHPVPIIYLFATRLHRFVDLNRLKLARDTSHYVNDPTGLANE